MRDPVRKVLLWLLVWCVGLQSNAWATHADCGLESGSASPSVATVPDVQVQPGHHHMPGMVMTNTHDEMVIAQMPEPQHSTHLLSADCGCKCGGLHCSSSATVASVQATGSFSGGGPGFIRVGLPANPEAGHGLDLIRPPSQS